MSGFEELKRDLATLFGAPQAPIDAMLAVREARALRWSITARMVFISIAPVVVVFSRRARPEAIFISVLILFGLALCFRSLRRLREPNPNLVRIGLMTIHFDLAVLLLMPTFWYYFVGQGEMPVAFLMKSEITTLSFVLIIINALSLRPIFPALVTFKVLMLHVVILLLSIRDPRTIFTDDIIKTFSSAETSPLIFVNRLLIILFVGGALTALARTARKVLQDVVDLERANARMQEEQAQRIMQAKMESLAGLVAGIAHEMNSPLGVMTSSVATVHTCAERINRGDRAEKAIGLLVPAAKAIGEASGRLQGLVSSLKSFARLDGSDVADISVADCVDDALALIPARLRGGVEVVRSFAADTPLLRGRPRELNQVFYTLIENAFEASVGRQEAKIELRVHVAKNGANILVEIEDNGVGIEAERIPRLFELDFRAKGGRMGIGLALPAAQAIVARHGGRISVESQQGRGSKFTAEIPLKNQLSGTSPRST